MSTAARAAVALVTFADPDGAGGVPRALRLLREGLAARGHGVTLHARPLAAGVRNTLVRRAWRRLDRSSEEVRRIRRALAALGTELRALPPGGVCVAFEPWTAATCAAAGRATVLRVAGLGASTDEWLRNGFVEEGSRHVPWLRATERAGFAGASRVVALSTAGRDAVLGLGADPSRIVVIPNGIAVAAAPPRAARDATGEVVVACVANLRAVKGVDVLARALASLPDALRARVRLVHVGDGAAAGNPTFEAARDALVAAGVAHTFRGALPHAEVEAQLAAADVFALPSRVEMFPNALLEACAAALPCVASDVGAVREILAPASGTSLVPPGDVAALAAALARLVNDAELRAQLGTANRAHVVATFALERTLDAWSRLVDDVARDAR